MEFEREETDSTVRLKIDGALSIYEATELRVELLGCLETNSGLELDLGGVTGCDTTGIQLLYATRKTAEAAQKTFYITNVPQPVLDALNNAGLRTENIIK